MVEGREGALAKRAEHQLAEGRGGHGEDPGLRLDLGPSPGREADLGRVAEVRPLLGVVDPERQLAARDWQSVQHYADAKTEIVHEILARARAAAAD